MHWILLLTTAFLFACTDRSDQSSPSHERQELAQESHGSKPQAASERSSIVDSIQARSQVDDRCALIDATLETMCVASVDVEGGSAEGGQLRGYFDHLVLRKLEADWFGETGRLKESYYVVDGDLRLARRVETRYSMPIYLSSSSIVETATDSAYYFQTNEDGPVWRTSAEHDSSIARWFSEAIDRLRGYRSMLNAQDCAGQ